VIHICRICSRETIPVTTFNKLMERKIAGRRENGSLLQLSKQRARNLKVCTLLAHIIPKIQDIDFVRTVLLHFLQKLDNDLATGSHKDLSPSSLFSVGDRFEAIGKNRYANHLKEYRKESK